MAGCGGASSRLSTAASSTPPPPTLAGSGAYGYVTAAPTCPVEHPGQPCPLRPVVARIQARIKSWTAAATESDSSGRYVLALSPGTYVLTASTAAAYPRCPPVQVSVPAGSPIRADIRCDTGIR